MQWVGKIQVQILVIALLNTRHIKIKLYWIFFFYFEKNDESFIRKTIMS